MSNSFWPHSLYSPWDSPGQNIGMGSLSLLQGSYQPRDRTQGSALQAHSLPIEPQGEHLPFINPLILAIVLTPASSVSPTSSFLYYAVLCLLSVVPDLCDPMDSTPPVFSVHVAAARKNTGVGRLSLLQENFPVQEHGVSCLAGGLFTSWATWETTVHYHQSTNIL